MNLPCIKLLAFIIAFYHTNPEKALAAGVSDGLCPPRKPASSYLTLFVLFWSPLFFVPLTSIHSILSYANAGKMQSRYTSYNKDINGIMENVAGKKQKKNTKIKVQF